MYEFLGSPLLLGLCLAALLVAALSWIATALGLFSPRTRSRVRVAAVIAIAIAIVIVAARFVVLGG